jgi:protein-arginine kinase activator protein McsA
MAFYKNFSKFNEASLKGNIGVPGEGGTTGSWLDTINREQREKVREFERNNVDLLRNFPRLIQDSQRIQRGKEKELSELCEKAFYQLFGTLLDDVTLDLKIGQEARQMMSETPEKSRVKIEDIVDDRVLNEIMKRKILRTIQQGKGLNSKSLLNLPLFKDGIKQILGERNAELYITNLNNVVKVMEFFDSTLSEAQITQAIKMNAQGACDIKVEEVKKDDEKKSKEAEQLLKDLESGVDLTETESDILSDVKVTVKARGVDMGILIHESLKGIYKLVTQMSLEHLPEEIAKQVLQNTDVVSGEPQEFKYGPSMQKQFEKVINTHPKVKSITDNLARNILNAEKEEVAIAENEMAAYQEQLFFYVFGQLATLGKDDPKEMLKVVYAVLSDKKDDIEKLFFPIVSICIDLIEQEFKYQQSKKKQVVQSPEVEQPKTKELTLSELQEELDDALDNEDYEKASQIRDEIKRRFNK